MSWYNGPLYHTYLPVEPLLAWLPEPGHRRGADGWDSPAKRCLNTLTKAQERAIHRAKVSGRISLSNADEIAVALGVHPSVVFGDAWFEVVDA